LIALPDTITETGQLVGATTLGGTSTPPLSAIGGLSPGYVEMVFDNATTETFSGVTASASQVDVVSALSTGQALDMAAAASSSSQNDGLIPANTGVIDWFQYAGNTYVVEDINSASTPGSQTALTATDEVVQILGLINLNDAQFTGHTFSF
jgi:hypothetical protein